MEAAGSPFFSRNVVTLCEKGCLGSQERKASSLFSCDAAHEGHLSFPSCLTPFIVSPFSFFFPRPTHSAGTRCVDRLKFSLADFYASLSSLRPARALVLSGFIEGLFFGFSKRSWIALLHGFSICSFFYWLFMYVLETKALFSVFRRNNHLYISLANLFRFFFQRRSRARVSERTMSLFRFFLFSLHRCACGSSSPLPSCSNIFPPLLCANFFGGACCRIDRPSFFGCPCLSILRMPPFFFRDLVADLS